MNKHFRELKSSESCLNRSLKQEIEKFYATLCHLNSGYRLLTEQSMTQTMQVVTCYIAKLSNINQLYLHLSKY